MAYKDPLKEKEYKKEYRIKNKDRRKEYAKEYYAKKRDKILGKQKEYYSKNQDKRKEYNKEYCSKNRDKIKEYDKEYCSKNRDKINVYRTKTRIKALNKIQSELKCVRCGCTDTRFLEINHKNGGGNKEYKMYGNMANEIRIGRRKTDDLELLCRPCNHIHYLEQKYGEKIPLKVVWNQPALDIRQYAWVRVRQ